MPRKSLPKPLIVACGLVIFSLAGFVITNLRPTEMPPPAATKKSHALAIATRARLAATEGSGPATPLTCRRVVQLGVIDIGTRCRAARGALAGLD